MKALAALRIEKVIVDPGSWHNGKIPRAAFPLSHVKTAHRLSKSWNWCVQLVEDGNGRRYRLLVAFEPQKEVYWAWLGAIFGDDQALIGRVELHHTHDGWHCHWKTGPLVEVARGAVKAPYPREMRHDCGVARLNVSKVDAFGIAYRLFNVRAPAPEGLGL